MAAAVAVVAVLAFQSPSEIFGEPAKNGKPIRPINNYVSISERDFW